MTYSLGTRSLAKLDGVHPNLAKVVWRAIEITKQDFSVAEGLRTPEQAAANFAKGTGIKDSLHIKQMDGYSHAVDLHPVPLDWKDLSAFRLVAAAMFQAADELNILIQWGADWDTDGRINEPGEWDYPHFQLPQLFRVPAARDARIRRMGERAAGEEVVL